VKDLPPYRRLTFWKSLPCAFLALWDEESGKLVGFDHLKKKGLVPTG
jgi:hypothetical protein